MLQESEDLRAVRTRKYIIEAFIELIEEKKFSNITINEISTKAMINRATFYRHFLDKYDLMDTVIKENLMATVLNEMAIINEPFSVELLKKLFVSITHFQISFTTRCQKSYHDMQANVQEILLAELERILLTTFQHKCPHHTSQQVNTLAKMLSWMLYAATLNWQQSDLVSAEEFIDQTFQEIKDLFQNELF